MFAAIGLAAPVAEAEPCFLDLLHQHNSFRFGIQASCDSCHVCEPCSQGQNPPPPPPPPQNKDDCDHPAPPAPAPPAPAPPSPPSVGNNNGIYLTPSGDLTFGNTIQGSVVFDGTVINGNLYVNTPFIGAGVGCVVPDGAGKLCIQPKPSGPQGWYVQDNNIFSSSNSLYACPDKHGNHFIYCGGDHKYKKPVSLHCH